MFNAHLIIAELARNKEIFRDILFNLPEDEYTWKPRPEKWCLLEIVCHLYDEEKEDFRNRVQYALEQPEYPLPPIDPQGWVISRNYIQQDISERLNEFLSERANSIGWLNGLKHPQWNNTLQHPKFGGMSGKLFLSNWLAHDYLHIRQILALKHGYLKMQTSESLSYAGDW